MRLSTTSPSQDPGRKHRRRLSAANVPLEGANAPSLWSHSSSATSSKPGARHSRRSSFNTRRLSIGGPAPLASPNVSTTVQRPHPQTRDKHSPRPSPSLSPVKRPSQSTPSSPATRPRSPPPALDPNTIPTLPRLTYDPASASSAGTPATPGLITPLSLPSTGNDYFAARPTQAHHSPKRGSVPGVTVGAYSPSGASTAVESRKALLSAGNSLRPDLNADNGKASESESSELARQSDSREHDKKTMLSRALQKAHTAVLLDNAQNYEGAIEAYEEACNLLQQVLLRSSGEEDRKKLDAIVSNQRGRSMITPLISSRSALPTQTACRNCYNST